MLLIGNGRLVTRDNGLFIENGAVVTVGNLILDVGETAALRARYPQAEFIDANGGLIMPGLINTHNHIYSAFARGLSIKGYSPRDFGDILEGMWWKIDRLLTKENDSLSAYAVYIDCIKNGVTTVFDHHASYFDIPGSLDTIADAAKELGIRTSLCYEVSDRDGEVKMKEAVLENARMIRRAEGDSSDMLKGMMGMHAAFTLSDETLALCKSHTPETTGFHIHVAEGPGDQVDSLKKYGKRIVERLWEQGILGEKTLAVHCVHVSPAEMRILKETDSMVVHNPESNMGNAVGCGPVIRLFEEGILLGLGTDGYTNDMLESYKVGNIIHKHNLCDPTVAWGEIPAMLFENNPLIAGRFFSRPLGVLKKGAYADVIVTDYDPLTPMDGTNVNGHILFGMNGRSVVTTVCNGKVLMRDRKVLVADEAAVMSECRKSSAKLWQSING
ncbi:putative aminohydrolase SsnA [bioreactor metagenome]|uniref:Putative aminohydrolase SsnA n=1 Tax=bioreactor metagenome TaxID=1076179 RepID=A0A644YTX4_9ZZZZ